MHVVDDRQQAGPRHGRSEPRLEELGVVVLGLEVDPHDGPPVALGPLRQECGLAEPRRRDDRDDRAARGRAEPVEQSRPNDGLSGRRRYDRARPRVVRAGQRFHEGHAISL